MTGAVQFLAAAITRCIHPCVRGACLEQGPLIKLAPPNTYNARCSASPAIYVAVVLHWTSFWEQLAPAGG